VWVTWEVRVRTGEDRDLWAGFTSPLRHPNNKGVRRLA
jgi:hypothetical protein